MELSSLSLFIASSISKTIATFATYPILTIRVRLQAAAKQEQDMVATMAKSLLTKEGLLSMYSGFFSKFLQTVLNNACTMVLYENIRVQTKNVIGQALLMLIVA